jgi:hypothetical protein
VRRASLRALLERIDPSRELLGYVGGVANPAAGGVEPPILHAGLDVGDGTVGGGHVLGGLHIVSFFTGR